MPLAAVEEAKAVGPNKSSSLTIRLLIRPPPPCGNLVKIPRKIATAENKAPANNIVACVLLTVLGLLRL